jgi:3-methyladenine DNA glycosylase AlkD
MTLQEAMRRLESMGTAQNRRVYARHGAGDNLFGVSFADLNKLKQEIKIDQALAEQLWQTGNADARSLATMIADPERISSEVLDAWAKEIRYYLLADLLVRHVVSRSPLAKEKMEAWTKAKQEFVGQAGWGILAMLAMQENEIPDGFFEKRLATIEKSIHTSKNRVRHAMNNAVIAIGIRSPTLRKLALTVAKRIGKVEVDHGETNCKTPDAAAYILKTVAHRKKRQWRT